MSDDINANMNMSVGGWSQGLTEAQQSAAKFIAFMDRVNAVFERVSKGSMDVAAGVSAIGGVSEAVRADLEMLHAGETTIEAVQASIGSTGAAMEAQVKAILAGNARYEDSLQALGSTFDITRLKQEQLAKAFEKAKGIEAGTRAGAMRSAQLVDPSGQPLVSRGRKRDPEAFLLTEPETAAQARMQRMFRRMKKMAEGAGIQDFKLPSLFSDEGKVGINFVKIQEAMDQLKDKIKEIRVEEQKSIDASETHRKKEIARSKEVQRQLEVEIALHKKKVAEQAKVHRTASFRQMDQMFINVPRSRIRELHTQGIITLGKETKKTESAVTTMFKKFEKGTALATKGTLGMVRGLQNANSQMALLTSSFTGLLAMIGGISAGAFFKMALDFEKAMTRVNLLVKKNESDFQTLSEQAKELSRQFGSSPLATAEGMRIAISSDIPPGEVMAFMKQAEKLAVTHNASIEKTTDLLAMLRNAFNLTTADMGRLRDMIFIMTDRGRVEVEQFASEIGKIAPTARLAGVNIQEMMAAFASLSRTRSTEQAGTLLRNLFKNIVDPSKEARAAIQEFGLGLTPAALKANGLLKTVANFRAELQKHPGLLNTVADDLRELAAWGDLTDAQFEALNSTFKEMTESVGIADIKTKEMMDTTAVRWERMMAQLKVSAIDMGSSLLGVFGDWTKGTGQVELLQKKIEKGFKQLELGIRYFGSAIQAVGVIATAVLGGIISAVAIVWGLLKTVFNFAQRAMVQLETIGDTDRLEKIQAQILKLKEGGLGEGSKEVMELAKEERRLSLILDQSLEQLTASEKGIAQTVEDTINTVKNSFDPMKSMAGAFFDNAMKADELAHQVADLDHVIELMEIDAKQLALGQQNLADKTGVAAEAIRDQTELIKQWHSETLKGQVLESHERLTQWIKDNRDAVKGAISANREWAKEQKRAAQEAFKELEKLQEQRDKWNDSMNETIEKIREKDRTPEQIVKKRKETALELERRANQALQRGDVDKATEIIEDAVKVYESLLEVTGADTKGNRKEVVRNLERLRDEMEKAYGFKTGDLETSIAASEAAANVFERLAKVSEEKLKSFEQGVVDVGRAIKDLGSAPSDEALLKVKEMILKLADDTSFFAKLTAQPLLESMDKVIEKAKELKGIMGTVPDELLMKLEGEQLFNLLRGTTGFVPVEPSNRVTNNTNSSITNVDTIKVDVAGEGGPKKVDARRLARDIKRNIQRGESPALGR